jgi:hypothetical protein
MSEGEPVDVLSFEHYVVDVWQFVDAQRALFPTVPFFLFGYGTDHRISGWESGRSAGAHGVLRTAGTPWAGKLPS